MKKQIIKALIAFLFAVVPMVAHATIGTTAGSGSTCSGSETSIPITVFDCNGVSAISLALNYDASKVTYLGYQNVSSHFGSNLYVNASGGAVYLTWFSLNAVDFGNETLIEFRFEGIEGSSALTWNTSFCEYSDSYGNVIASSYTNGSVTVYNQPAITSQPNNVSVTEGESASFYVGATGTNLSYQWQVSTNGGMTWSSLSNGTYYNNVTSSQMSITNIPMSFNGYHYRCMVTGTCEPVVYSNAALLTVNDLLPTIQTIANNVTSCPSTEFSVPISVTSCNNVGAISLALNYNVSMVTFLGYDNVNPGLESGVLRIHAEDGVVYIVWIAGHAPLNIGNTELFNLQFESLPGNSNFTWDNSQCEYSTPAGVLFPSSFTSGTVSIYYAPTITSQPSNRTIEEYSNTTFSVGASGTNIAYQWQVSTNNGVQWNDLSNGVQYNNVTSSTLTVINASSEMDQYQYRCKVTGTCDPAAYSDAAILNVIPYLPTINTQLVSVTACQDVMFDADIMVNNFERVGSISLALTYNTSLLTFEGYENMHDALWDGTLFVNEDEGTIYISWMSVYGISFLNGRLLSLKFIGNPGTANLNWVTDRCEYANRQGLIFPTTFQNGTATVNAAPYINTHPENKTVIEGSNTTFSVNAGGHSLSYQWQVSSNEGTSWNGLNNGNHYSNVTSSTLNVNNATLDMNGLRYRCIISGGCEPETVSNSAKLTVNHLIPTITTQVGSLTTCSETEFSIPVSVTEFNNVGAFSLALTYNTDILTFQGYEGVNNHLINGDLQVNANDGVVYATWMSAAGASIGNNTLLWLRFTGNQGYSSLVWNTASCEYATLAGEIIPATYTHGSVTVNPVNFTINSHPQDQIILEGESTSFAISATGTNLTYTWQVSEDHGASWSNLTNNGTYANVSTNTLQINGATTDMNGNRYRCSVYGGCGTQCSNAALLTVGTPLELFEVTAGVSPANSGFVTGAGSYYDGDNVTMGANANTGYQFVNWTEGSNVVSDEATFTFVIHGNRNLTANFAVSQYEVTLSSNIGSAGTLTGDGTYNHGSTCTVTAVANAGYVFLHWTENGNVITTNPSFTFTVTGSRTFVAMFEQRQYEIQATALPEEGGTVTGSGSFSYGETCTLTATANDGYVFTNWSENNEIVSAEANYSFTVEGDRTLVANFVVHQGGIPIGAINGLFSISEGTQVYFSRGNMQYQATSGIWRFAPNQYDCIGNDNSNISPNYDGWIDLFGWGTGNNPTNCSTNSADYSTFVDWGTNDISNGGIIHLWRTMTNAEWRYLYFNRSTASGYRYALAKVNGVCGLILFPDNWSSSIYNVNSVNRVGNYNANVISASVWVSVFETNGAVFLPAAGERDNGTTISGLDWNGEYWTSTPGSNASYPFHAWFHGTNIGTDTGHQRYYGKSVRLVSPCSVVTHDINATIDPVGSGTVSGDGSYIEGSTCVLTATANEGYAFVNWTEDGNVVSTDAEYSFTVTSDRSLVANFAAESSVPVGAINGLFSVGEGTQVYFSQGNLQFIGSAETPYWKFADNQWECLGTNSGQNSNSPNVDRDLFGWGTSGNDHGAVAYQPWAINASPADYLAYGKPRYNLDDANGTADWGINPIANGGNQFNSGWRTPSMDEWVYLLSTRNASTLNGTPNARFAKARVNRIPGIILFPDSYTHPNGVALPSSINATGNTGWAENVYSAAAFALMQANGAVFLPAAGIRNKAAVSNVNSNGFYWASTLYNNKCPYHMFFKSTDVGPQNRNVARNFGIAVRLIRPGSDPAPVPTYTIEAQASPANGGTVSGTGSYSEGETCILTALPAQGFAFVNWTENGTQVSTARSYSFTVEADRALTANFIPAGAINGLFSVGEGAQVYFSQGNLQFIGSADNPYWKFADYQWECLGTNSGQNSSSPNVDRDLFGWGTSGNDHGAVAYQPWAINASPADYLAYGRPRYNLDDANGTADWGINPIANGGNQFNSGWRTPSMDEWVYLLSTRNASTLNGTPNARFAKARVNRIPGIILFPDNYSHPNGVALPSSINATGNTGWAENVYSAAAFALMQKNGAVFLPAAGIRNKAAVSNVNSSGFYWASNLYNNKYPYHMFFKSTDVGPQNRNVARNFGIAVRLIRPADAAATAAYNNAVDGSNVASEEMYDGGEFLTIEDTPVDMNGGQSVPVYVYPNPTKGVFNVEGEGIRKVEVMDAYGLVVFSKEVGNGILQIDLGGKAAGAYLLRVVTDKGVTTKKLVKE